MRAAVCDELPAKLLDVREVDDPTLGPSDLLIDVEACGICGTDLHVLSGESYRPSRMPFVLGHEPVGIVREVGSGVGDAWLGERITITLFTGCGTCEFCARNDERLCTALRDITGIWSSWGGYAERMVVREKQAVGVPRGLSSQAAATLVDAGATAMNAAGVVRQFGQRRAIIMGGGPVGFLVAELLRDSCELLLVEPASARRDVLRQLGYRVVPMPGDVEQPAEVVVDCAGVPAIVPWAIEHLQPRGLYVVVGYCSVPLLDFGQVARKELTIRGVRSGSRADLAAILDLASAKEIRLPPVDVWRLDEINDALEALRLGNVEGKAIIVP